MEINWVEVPENSVIILRADDYPDENDSVWDDRFQLLHEHYPTCLVVALYGEDTLEVRPLDEMRALLQDLIAHQEAMDA